MAKPKTFKAIRPNAGLEALYRKRISRLVEQMAKSVTFHVKRAYAGNTPLIAQDALPATTLRKVLRDLRRRWEAQFAEAAPRLARYFATRIENRNRLDLKRILKDGGFSVKMTLSPAQRDILEATVTENVSLIKSIPEQYFTQIEGAVMRSVSAGRDLSTLSRNLQRHYGVTKRRAALIARDQNNKATAMLTKARQEELGLNKAVWQHSHAGKKPRPTHVAMDGKTYDVRKGMYDKAVGEWVFPGQLINCRCYSKTIIPGLS
jgi:SPP1 gp7 family putative phage head morphogenesis protein